VASVTVEGEGSETLPADETNLVFKAMEAGFSGKRFRKGA